jgi:hypothetical protein
MQPRHRISSGSPYEDRIGFSRAIAIGDRFVKALLDPRWKVEIEAEAQG